MSNFNKTLLENLDSLDSFALNESENVREWDELETGDYRDFRHVNEVWNYLEDSKSEKDLKNRINKVDPKKFGSVYYDLHEDGEGATVVIDYSSEDEDYYEKVDVYFSELDEAEGTDSDDDIKLFMNTYANYNEYGADGVTTPTGWMSPEQALEYMKKYAKYEPFINDSDNCPWEVSELASEEDINDMIRYNEYSDKEIIKNLVEVGGYGDAIGEYIDIAESGDYIWLPGVDNDEDLGRAYVDSILGGIDLVSGKDNYFDRDSYKEDIYADARSVYMSDNDIESDDDFEENYEGDFEDYLDMLADTYEESGNISDYYFDYEKLGRELSMDGFTFTSDGAMQILK